MSDKLQILIEAILAKTTKEQLTQELKNIEKNLKPIEIKANVDKIAKQFQVLADGSKQLQKVTTDITNQFGQQVKTIENIGGKTQEVVAQNFKAQKEASIKISDMARKLTFEENQDRLKQVTATQNKIERTITQSNETIAQRNMRSETLNTNPTQYEQAYKKLLYNQEESIINEKQKTIELEKQIILTKEELAIRMQKAGTTYGDNLSKTGVSSLINKADSLNAQNYDTVIKEINLDEKKLIANAMELRNTNSRTMDKTDGFMKTLSKDFGKMIAWSLVGGALFGSLRELQKGIGYVSELNNQLTKLRIEMNLSDSDLTKMTSSAQSMAKELGSTVSEVLKAAEVYSNINETVDSIVEKTRAGIVLSNLGGIDIASATDAIQAISLQFGILEKDSMHITDVITKVSAGVGIDFNKAVTTISDAIKVSGNVAQEAGISLESYSAIVAGIAERTRLPGSTLGQSMKTIITRTQRVTSDETSMDDISKAETALRSVNIEVRKSATEFKNFDTTMGELAGRWDTLSGTQKSYISYQLAGTRQINIMDAMMKEWSNTTQLTTDALNSQGFAMEKNGIYMESNEAKIKLLTTSIETAWQNTLSSDLINGFITTLTSFISTFGNLGTVITLVATGLLLWKGTALSATLGLKSFSLATNLATSSIGLFNKFGQAMMFQEAGMVTTTQALAFSFKALGVSIKTAFLANPLGWIALGIMAIVGAVDYANAQVEKQKQIFEDLKTNIQSLQSSIDQLEGKGNRTTEEQKTLDILKLQILAQKQLLADAIELRVEKEIQNKAMHKDDANTGLGGVTGISNISNNIKGNVVSDDIAQLQKYKDELSKLNGTTKDYNKTKSDLNTKISEGNNLLTSEYIANQANMTTLKETGRQDTVAYKNLEKRNKAIEDAIGIQNEVEVATNNATDATTKQKQSQEELASAFKESTDNMMVYNDMIQELEKSHKLSAENVNKIIADYPQLLGYLGDESELHKQLILLKEEEAKKQRIAYVQMLQDSEEFYNFKIKGNTELNNKVKDLYGIDLKNYKTLAQAKEVIENKLLESLRSKWSLYFDAERKMLTTDYTELSRINPNMAKQIYTDVAGYFQQSNKFDDIVGKFVSSDFSAINTSKNTNGSTSDPSPITHDDMSATYIKAYNAEVEKDKVLSKSLETQIKIAKVQKDYNKELELTNKLIKNQEKTVSDLNSANSQINEKANSIRSANSQYDTTKWFDVNSEATTDYAKLLATFDGMTDNASKREKKNIEDLFKSLSDLKKAWSDNTIEAGSFGDSLDSLNATIEDNIKAQIQLQLEAQQKIDELILKDKHDREQDDFDAQKTIDDEVFSVKQQGEKDNFEAIKKIRDNAFSEQLQQQQDNFDKQKAIEDKAFEDSQQRQKTNLSAQTYGVTESDYNTYKANKIAKLTQGIAGLQGIAGSDSEIQAKQTEIDNLNAQSFSDLTDYQQLYTDIHQVRIDALDAEITALQATNEAQAETETRLKNQNDLIEKQTALKNALDNKNVQQLKKQSDGSWQYEYVADADVVESAQKAVDDQITSNNDWESQTTLKHKQDLLNQEKQYEQDLINAKNNLADTLQSNLDKQLVIEKTTYDNAYILRQNALDASLKSQQDSYDIAELKKQKTIDNNLKAEQLAYDTAEAIKQTTLTNAQNVENLNLTTHYADMNTLVDIGLKELEKTYGNDWDKINETIKSKLDIAKELYAELALIQAETGSLESADINNGGNSPTNVKTPQQLYAEARANGDWQGMEDANESANNGIITASVDIEYIKKKYGHVTGGEVGKTGFQWLDGSLQKPERVLSAEQTLSFNKLVANLPNLMNLIKSPSLLDLSSFKLGNNSKTEQTFYIDKLEFPNVTNHTEIVQALDTISLRAKQYSTTKTYGLNQ